MLFASLQAHAQVGQQFQGRLVPFQGRPARQPQAGQQPQGRQVPVAQTGNLSAPPSYQLPAAQSGQQFVPPSFQLPAAHAHRQLHGSSHMGGLPVPANHWQLTGGTADQSSRPQQDTDGTEVDMEVSSGPEDEGPQGGPGEQPSSEEPEQPDME